MDASRTTQASVRLRPAHGDSDAAFIADQMLTSALEFAEPGVPFGLAEQASKPETKRRWHESCRKKVADSLQPEAAAHTRVLGHLSGSTVYE